MSRLITTWLGSITQQSNKSSQFYGFHVTPACNKLCVISVPEIALRHHQFKTSGSSPRRTFQARTYDWLPTTLSPVVQEFSGRHREIIGSVIRHATRDTACSSNCLQWLQIQRSLRGRLDEYDCAFYRIIHAWLASRSAAKKFSGFDEERVANLARRARLRFSPHGKQCWLAEHVVATPLPLQVQHPTCEGCPFVPIQVRLVFFKFCY